MTEIHSPYKARPLFFPLHERSTRWSIGVCHRRSGKTVSHINELVIGATKCQLPNPRFAYVAPQLNQAKDIAWTYLKHFTAFASPRVNESELWVELPGGARIRIYGDTAAVQGTSTYHIKNMATPISVIFTRVWVKSHGEWQVVNHQSTGLPSTPSR